MKSYSIDKFRNAYPIVPFLKEFPISRKADYLIIPIALGILGLCIIHLVVVGIKSNEKRRIYKLNRNQTDIEAIRKRRWEENLQIQNIERQPELIPREKINTLGLHILGTEKKILKRRSKLLVNVSGVALRKCLKSIKSEFPDNQSIINRILNDPARLNLLTNQPHLLHKLTIEMHKKGFEFPPYYTSLQFAKVELELIREQERLKFKKWKKFGIARGDDLDYQKPRVKMSGLFLNSSQKRKLKKTCLEKYKKAQQQLDWVVADVCMEYFDSKNNKYLPLINHLSKKYLDILRAMAAINPPAVQGRTDPFHTYLQNIFANTAQFSGSIGDSPQRIINLIEGRYDDEEKPYPLLRTKLFFLYRLGRQANEIMKSPTLCKKIDDWLEANGKDWRLEMKLIRQMRRKAPFFLSRYPLYVRGVQGLQNEYCFLRTLRSARSLEEQMVKDPNLTFHQSAQAARHKSHQNTRFRTEFTRQEVLNYIGEILPAREQKVRNQLRMNAIFEKGIREFYDLECGSSKTKLPRKSLRLNYLDLANGVKPDTGYSESLQKYKMKTTMVPWVPGKHAYRLHQNIPFVRYNYIVKKMRFSSIAGISGTLDQALVMAGMVGAHSKKEMMDLRFIYLGWMLASEDHSFHEVMQSSKSFGLPYTPAADSYKQIYPGDRELIERLSKHQKRRGFELPDYYLSNEFVKLKAKQMFYHF